MTIQQRKNFLINIAYATIVLVIIGGLMKFATLYLMPFIIGFVIATLVKPVVRYTNKLFGNKKWLAIGVMVLFYALVAALLFWLSLRAIAMVQYYIPKLDSFYDNTLVPMIQQGAADLESWLSLLDPKIASIVDTAMNDFLKNLNVYASSMSSAAIVWATGIVTSIPNLFIAILITVISSFFFTLDYSNIVSFCLKLLPERGRMMVFDIKTIFSSLIGKYLKSYAILMSLTFVELSIGFWILGLPKPILLGFVISIIDILPVLGTGTVLIPWAIFSIVTGNTTFGVGMILVYSVITVVRNVLEPKVIGKEIGLHPLATLVSIFVGLKMFGFAGLFILPISVTILKTLHDEGKLDILKFFGFKDGKKSVEKQT